MKNPMKKEDIIHFLFNEIEPISDVMSKNAYCASIYTIDDIYLPCVIFRSVVERVDHAIRRFDETRHIETPPDAARKQKISYRDVVQVFVASGNRINDYEITRIENSPYAIPPTIHSKLWAAGETGMGYTAFIGIMDDGKEFPFITNFGIEFFEMPEGYTASRIKDIIPHKNIKGIQFRNKPFFDCYLKF